MIRIAAVSSKEFIDQIMKYEKRMPDITITPFIYENPLESESVVRQICDCDVVLFAGPLPYLLSKDYLKDRKWPAVYIPSDEYTLTTTLFHTLVNRPGGLNRLSIDIQTEKYIARVAEEINLSSKDWFIFDSSPSMGKGAKQFDADAIIQFHKELYESGQSEYALTSVDYVYSKLQQMGVPSSCLIVPEKAISDSINKAITYGQLAISQNAGIAIGIVVFHQKDSLLYDFGNLKQDATIVLKQMLLDLVKATETSVRLTGMDQFIIYGTRGSVEQLVGTDMLQPFLQKIDQFMDLTVSMGFGFGLTAKEAEENAYAALFHAKKHVGRNSVFLASGEKKIIGPLNAEKREFALQSNDARVLEVAELTNTSVATVTKLLQFSRMRRGNGFTTVALSEYLGISRRSTERLVKKFLDNGLAKKIGEEQPYTHGRPRAVYRIDLD